MPHSYGRTLSDLSLSSHVPDAERIILEGLRFKSIARVTYITQCRRRGYGCT
ncbi:MAG: hypothetical protein MZV63_47340 [Marinilabiliales bacterium]|nr:hypothetical protein [Marinilabiliales bacterium]